MRMYITSAEDRMVRAHPDGINAGLRSLLSAEHVAVVDHLVHHEEHPENIHTIITENAVLLKERVVEEDTVCQDIAKYL